MEAIEEFLPLTRSAIREMLLARQPAVAPTNHERRRAPRWPFACPVEVWTQAGDGVEYHQLATCSDLSESGAGILCDEALPVGATLNIAIHQPEATFHGRGQVRHCRGQGRNFVVGIEFIDP